MQVKELEQNSLAWHEHRAKYRNASEAGSVMDCNPYQTKRELWESKNGQGKPFVGNVATDYGHKMEPFALARVSELLGVHLASAIFVEGEYSASLDAYGEKDGETYRVEIKCPYQKEKSKLWSTALDGDIPEFYYWQQVHQGICAPTDHAYFFVYIADDAYKLIDFVTFQGDEIALKSEWDHFMANEPAPAFAVREDLERLGNRYLMIKSKHDEVSEELKAIETELKDACEVDSQAGPVKIQVITRTGSVDYKKVPELKGIDLNDYRKPSTTYKKIIKS